MARMNNTDIARILEEEIVEGDGGEYGASSLQETRRLAWRYYLGRSRGDEVEGRSQLQSLDVSDSVEASLAQMMTAFTSDCPAEFEPNGPQDEAQAQLESDACNYLLMEENHGYSVLYQAIKDALLFGDGIVKVYVEDSEDQQSMTLDGVSGDDATLVEAVVPEDATVERKDDALTISITEQTRRLRIEAIEPAQFVVTANWHKHTLDDVPFCAERKFFSRSDLIKMGFARSKVDQLPAHTMDTQSDTIAKWMDESTGSIQGTTRAQDLIEVWECYAMLPKNLNSSATTSERYRVFMSNRVILEKEKVAIVPYAHGCVWLVQHRFNGLSVYQKLKQVQDSKTMALRSYTDHLARSNMPSLFLQGDINTEDLASLSAPGHHLRGGLNSQATQLTNGDIGAASLAYLQYMDTVRASRAGAAIDLGSAESQLFKAASGAGATGAAIAQNEMEMMTASMTRCVSETLMRQLFLLIHRVGREQYRQPMMLQMAGQYVPVNPSTWQPRSRLNVKTGLSSGERSRKVTALGQLMQAQMGLMQIAPHLVDERSMYSLIVDLAKASEVDNPEQYLLHPDSPQAQQRQQQLAQGQQQQQSMQMQLQTLSDQVKLQIAQMEDKTKREIAALDAEIEEMKVTGEAVKEFELERIRNSQDSSGSNGADGGNQPARES